MNICVIVQNIIRGMWNLRTGVRKCPTIYTYFIEKCYIRTCVRIYLTYLIHKYSCANDGIPLYGWNSPNWYLRTDVRKLKNVSFPEADNPHKRHIYERTFVYINNILLSTGTHTCQCRSLDQGLMWTLRTHVRNYPVITCLIDQITCYYISFTNGRS